MKHVEAGREPVVSVKGTRALAGELGTPLLPGLYGQAKPTSGMIGDSIWATIQAMSYPDNLGRGSEASIRPERAPMLEDEGSSSSCLQTKESPATPSWVATLMSETGTLQ